MAIKPRPQGISRISESESIRSTSNNKSQIRNGKTCVGCKKHYGYLKPAQRLCISCEKRYHSLIEKQ